MNAPEMQIQLHISSIMRAPGNVLPLLFLCSVALVTAVSSYPEPSNSLTAYARPQYLRALLQASGCNRIHKACMQCRKQGAKVVCTKCATGWTLRNEACDCSPGRALNSTGPNGWCTACPAGLYCPGGPGNAAKQCPEGLATTIAGAKSPAQCLTKAGYGRRSIPAENGKVVRVEAMVCPIGTWGAGGTDGECTPCPAGLTTAKEKSTSATACMAPAGSLMGPDNTAVACPKGTYTTAVNLASSCLNCPDGLTTESEASTSPAACNIALPGYYVTGEGTAEPCPIGWYNSQEGQVTECKQCPEGLTTVSTNTTSVDACMAPAGSYIDNYGTATKCEKGTYTTTPNTETSCSLCPNGTTTANEGSSSDGDCNIPMKGWHMPNPMQPEPCPVGYYNDEELPGAVCKACPNGLQTPAAGADSAALCQTPPGWELRSGADMITACEEGYYNDQWGMNPCTVCGQGLITNGKGTASKSGCLVPPGMGLISFTMRPWLAVAVACSGNRYGTTVPIAATDTPTPRCQQCPRNTYTQDNWKARDTNVPFAGYMSVDECLVAPGWGAIRDEAGALVDVARCGKGYYNAGMNQLACQQCPEGTLTDMEGALAVTDCYTPL